MIEINHLTFNDNRGSYTPIPLNVLNEKWDQCSISVNDKIYTPLEDYITKQIHHKKNTLKS